VGSGTMSRDVVIIYKLRGGHFERIFAAELGRRIGDKRIVAKMKLGAGAIVLSPGKATGYDEGSYPWLQKKSPDGGFEPLILPWGGITRLELRFDGEKFVRTS
jgi:hypothetical protein